MEGTEQLAEQNRKHHIDPQAARKFAAALLVSHGVKAEQASLIADCLVAADLRGIDTHGVQRLPSYIARIRQGVLAEGVTPSVKEVTPVVAHVDAHNGFGFPAAAAGIDFAISAAKTYGIGMASVTHSNHFGMSAWIVQRAIDANMMSLVFTNSSPALPAFGGREKLLGVSPIACGAPGKDGKHFILDMAPYVPPLCLCSIALVRKWQRSLMGAALQKRSCSRQSVQSFETRREDSHRLGSRQAWQNH